MHTSGWIRNEGDETGEAGAGDWAAGCSRRGAGREVQIRLPLLQIDAAPGPQMPCLREPDMPAGTRSKACILLMERGARYAPPIRRDRCELWRWQCQARGGARPASRELI